MYTFFFEFVQYYGLNVQSKTFYYFTVGAWPF